MASLMKLSVPVQVISRASRDLCQRPICRLLVASAFLSIATVLIYSLSKFWVEIHRIDELDFGHDNNVSLKNRIPKVIHQIWLDFGAAVPPVKYQHMSERIRRMNPGYEYKLWKDADVEILLHEDYPWFADSYHSYPYHVQKVDAIRYFIIHKHGGLYTDIDNFFKMSLDEFISRNHLDRYSCTFPRSLPSGITNHIILCEPKSPFLDYVTQQLPAHNRNYGIPYATIMWGAGSRFLTARLGEFPSQQRRDLAVIPYNKLPEYVHFETKGNWMGWDGLFLHIFSPTFNNRYVFGGFLLILMGLFLLVGVLLGYKLMIAMIVCTTLRNKIMFV